MKHILILLAIVVAFITLPFWALPYCLIARTSLKKAAADSNKE